MGFEISRLICFSDGARIVLVIDVVLRLVAALLCRMLCRSLATQVEVWLLYTLGLLGTFAGALSRPCLVGTSSTEIWTSLFNGGFWTPQFSRSLSVYTLSRMFGPSSSLSASRSGSADWIYVTDMNCVCVMS